MKIRMLVLIFVITAGIMLLTACSSESTTSATAPSNSDTTSDGATLLQERCTVCHTLSRVESAKNTSAEWGSIVDQMIGKGAKLSSDEKALVVDYLSVTYGK